MKYLGIKLTQHVQDLYEENLTTEIKELNKWRDSLCPWIGSLNIVKMSVFPNSVDRCNATH